LNSPARKAAHWELGRAFHEKNHVAGFNDVIDALLGVAHGDTPLGWFWRTGQTLEMVS
jgi:hypothetical protein